MMEETICLNQTRVAETKEVTAYPTENGVLELDGTRQRL